jgi:Protein of unknown function (DUF3341)
MNKALYGLMAEFASPEELVEAARAAKKAGYVRVDAFSPFPLPDVADVLGYRRYRIALAALLAALAGGIVQYGAQYWMNVVDYPINVGGRPLHSWPAFIPPALTVSILWAAVAIFAAFLFLTRLPRLHHPIFEDREFERVTDDGFFLGIRRDDPLFDREATCRFLEVLGASAVREIRE